jgi:O-antigen ligase
MSLPSVAPPYVFWLLVAFLILEYIRPPVVVKLKLQFLITLAVPVLFLSARKRPWSRALTVQVFFLAFCIAWIPFAYNWYAVYWTVRTLYGIIAIAVVLTWVCSQLRDFRRIMWLYMGIMVYQAFWSLGHGGTGTGGFLGDENDLALACITAFPIAFFQFERLKGSAQIVSGVALAILVAGVVASMSRGGFVGLVVCAGYCWAMSRHKVRGVVLALIAVVMVPILAPPTYIDELRSIADTNKGTARGRRFLWTCAFNMWKAHPVLGVGGGNSIYLMGKYQPTTYEERQFQERDWSGTTVHSFYFQVLPEHGVVGILVIGFLIWTHFSASRRIIRRMGDRRRAPPLVRRDAVIYAHALNGSLLGFLAAALFLSVAYYPYFWYFTALSLTLELAVLRELTRTASRRARAPESAAQ